MDSHSLLAPNSRYYSPSCSQRDSRLNNVRLSAANDEQPATLRRKLHNQRIHSKRQQQSIKETVPEMVLSSQQLILMRKDYQRSPRDRAVDASTDKTSILKYDESNKKFLSICSPSRNSNLPGLVQPLSR